MAEYKYGSVANKQQGTQEAPIAKRRSASAYSRSSQRAAPSGNTKGFKSDFKAEREATAKKYNFGKYSRQKLFP